MSLAAYEFFVTFVVDTERWASGLAYFCGEG